MHRPGAFESLISRGKLWWPDISPGEHLPSISPLGSGSSLSLQDCAPLWSTAVSPPDRRQNPGPFLSGLAPCQHQDKSPQAGTDLGVQVMDHLKCRK